jgi:hypothetical protein
MTAATARTAKRIAAIGAALAAFTAIPAAAGEGPTTRLVKCKTGSCLVVNGRRSHADAAVTINGRAVAAQGARSWRVSLPVETLRLWSRPYARSITVAVTDPTTGVSDTAQAWLPIGLLGHAEDLAMLVVRVK